MGAVDHPQTRLCIRAHHWNAMEEHVKSLAPEEACGLIAGQEQKSELVIPVTNLLHSSVRFFMQPEKLLQALEKIDATGLRLLAIYHSHPYGPDHPSPVDLEEYNYPEAVAVIWYPEEKSDERWRCKGFAIRNKQYVPVKVTRIFKE